MVRYSKEDVLNEPERLKLMSSCQNKKEELVIKTLLFTGMRISEFCNMKEVWIDWHKAEIHIPQTEDKSRTKKHSRVIPIYNFEVKNLLYQYFQAHKEINFNRSTGWRIVKRVASRIRPFKKVYPHSLRATYASSLAEQGVSAADLQYVMGWSKLETANHYVRSTKAVENVRELMR